MKLFAARPTRRPVLVHLLAASALVLTGTFATDARAITAWPSDCGGIGDEKTVFNPGDPVCVTGELDIIPPDEFVCAAGWTSVIPAGAANPFGDVSRGGANYVLGCAGAGAFFDEVLWLPPLMPGRYEITIDQYPFFPETGVFGAEDYRVLQAITVTNAPIVFSVDVAAIKLAAEDGLRFAESIDTLTKLLTLIDVLSTASDWSGAFGLYGGAAALVLGYVCYRTETDCPTSYDSAVITIGNKILGGISRQLARHYSAIILDPPDPAYDVVVGLDESELLPLGAPFTPGAARELPERQIAVAQLLALQSAAAQALVPTLEKLQGAQNDGSNAGMMIQAEKLRAYAELSLAAGDTMLGELDALEAYLGAQGTLDDTVDVAGAMEELRAGGLDDDGRALLSSFGVDDQTADETLAELLTLEVPPAVSWAATLAATRGAAESMHDALVDLAAQAEQVRAENEPYALRLAPLATTSGPAQGSVGQAVSLGASAAHWDPAAEITWAWDADLDGAFDDGGGDALSFTPTAPGRTVVAVRATDPDDRADVALHLLEVASTNAPPEIVSSSPAEPAPFAEVGEVVDFEVGAEDADADPLTFSWRVDGAAQSDAATFAFTMPDEEPHRVQVTVADDDPYSPDAVLNFVVRAAKWEGSTGEPDPDGGAGGDGDADADGGPGGGDGDGGRSSGGCGCRTAGSGVGETPLLGLALGLGLVVTLLARRRHA